MNRLWPIIAIIFIAHLALYYMLGTPNWIGVAAMASAFWALVLIGVRYLLRLRRKERT
ncbi:hypothetical protein PP175_09420 [Aneurinibacillus sp. Ricciae_BoGa-3]|uniref:hypothetical protein n=1 Tax=Aneurinibacillus sp. Ricciae_BoGa-3 TaxID=3022697 RepID=UPI002340A52B|nr:hypothetical protein [Aneurinibacillus sp. Ricciae_BoGa-3]WCK56103.1 hypothetical protein PP175_09420 [Aneurinibacillus sp. Ricciae_BoGa-3]